VKIANHQLVLLDANLAMFSGNDGQRDAQITFLTTPNQCYGTGQLEFLYRAVFFQKEQIYLHIKSFEKVFVNTCIIPYLSAGLQEKCCWKITVFCPKLEKMNYKAVIFDLDGTLVDTLDDLTDAMNQALAWLGQPGRSRDECRDMIGRGLPEFAKSALPADALHLRDALLRKMREIYLGICLNRTQPYDGIREVLSACQKQQIRLGVLSNKAHDLTVRISEHYFGKETFCRILGLKDNVKAKPDAQPVFILLDQMQLKPADVLYVGDSEVDVQTARNAGVDCIAAGWGFRSVEILKKAGAKIIVSRPLELMEYL
jgi:phosphoglycolate phosphatase